MYVMAEYVQAVMTPTTKAVIVVHLLVNVAPVAEIKALGEPELEDAILRVQLPHLDSWAAARVAAGDAYAEALEGVVTLPKATDGSRPAWHLYVIRHDEPDALLAGLKEQGIGARPYYRVPVHA